MINNESGQHLARGTVTVQSLCVLQNSLVLNVFVPEGQATVIDSTLNVQSGARRVTFVLRATTSAREPVTALQLSNGHSPLEIFDASYVCPPRVDVEGSGLDGVLPRSLDALFDAGAPNFGGTVLQGVLRMGDQASVEDALGDNGLHEVQGLSTWLLVHPAQPGEPGKSAKGVLGPDSAVLAQARATETANIALTLRRGEKNGATLAALTMPVVYGEASAAVIAAESEFVGAADVEVAQGAATVDPVIHDAFDGLVVRIRPTRATDGATIIVLTARGHVLSGPMQDIEVGAPLSLPAKRCEFDNLMVDERLSFTAKSGVQRISLGGTGGLVLDFELR